MKSDAESRRAVHIAAVIMQRSGLCRHESYVKCRRLAPTDEDCIKCIERWLLSKARSEIRKKGRT